MFSKLMVSASLALVAQAALPAINTTGNAFWNTETGERFYIRGVDYQPGGSSNLTDPLADETICMRDIPYFEQLGINTIRVYSIDNSMDHTACMKALDAAGIYLILDVNTPKASISRVSPSCSYNSDYLQNVFATIDEFSSYDNVLGFFAGNEVIDSVNNTDTATYVKATVRDMKKYLKARNYRQIPVGYSAADVTSNRYLAAEYFNCGDDEDARIDMFGVNDYSWCGASSYTVSGYSQKVALYSGYSIPIFLSEYGCNTVKTDGARLFTEVEAIYSSQMAAVFSGGLAYEYSQEANDYGLVQISDDGLNVTTLTDFDNLKNELNKTSNPSGNGGAVSTYSISSCPTYEAGIWEANNTLPDMPEAASVYFTSGAGTPQGTGFATQWSCYDDDSDADSEDSSSSFSTTTTAAAVSSTLSSSIVSSATASGKAATSSSKAAGSIVDVPVIFNLMIGGVDGSLAVAASVAALAFGTALTI
ncbi:hypothetical protein WICPIJ_006235 [Wickerhamomyces pijperi]|uniref:1,3-beta-glucanosyltransferase n=1 Tax=Wickerhamomyces pijperi TaxID=599730 RepID=A0A9P8TLK2_WICPI|nr:hypothetical protein WICPIJ_006235 [Wickerhamomyces pijperi]